MALRNRVTPDGEIVATAARGTFMGNRGRLHRPDRTLGDRRWTGKAWIVCRLCFRGRRRTVMAPGRYTELFFLDEAVALAAGHRPCAECRREAYLEWKALWQAVHGGPPPAAAEMDAALHGARVAPPTKAPVRHRAALSTLPEGTFVRLEPGGAPLLVLGDRLLPYAPGGYGPPRPRPADETATVLTPRPTVAILARGYRPALHPSAENAAN